MKGDRTTNRTDGLPPIARSWERSLKSRRRSEATIDSYLTDLRRFCDHFGSDPTTATRGDLEEFQTAGIEAGLAPATVGRRYRSLRQFFRYLEEIGPREGGIELSPFHRMEAPSVPVDPPDVIGDDELAALLAACRPRGRGEYLRHTNKGTDENFERTRDTAMIHVLVRMGLRASELVGLQLTDVDHERDLMTVHGKGERVRVLTVDATVGDALDRYLRNRRNHPRRDTTAALWLGDRGPLTGSGLRQMLERRCAAAGIRHLNPHLFRHTYAHRAKVMGMTDETLMHNAGWRSPQMLHRYGASHRAERAREETRRLMDGD